MRTTALTALAIVAIASPALAAPLHTAAFARDDAPAFDPSDADESGALSLKNLGHAATIAGAGAPIIGAIVDHFSHHDQQQPPPPAPQRRRVNGSPHFRSSKTGIGRWLPPVGKRELPELAKREDEDESGAFSLKNLGHAATIAGAGAPIIGAIVDHFSHHDQQQQPPPAPQRRRVKGSPHFRSSKTGIGRWLPPVGKRDLPELAAREDDSDDGDDGDDGDDDEQESGAFSLKNLGHAATIAGAGAPIIGAIVDHFSHHDQPPPPAQAPQRREILELLARAEASDESGALGLPGPLGLIGDAVKIGSGIASAVKKHKKHHKHKKPKARDLIAELLVRSLEELD